MVITKILGGTLGSVLSVTPGLHPYAKNFWRDSGISVGVTPGLPPSLEISAGENEGFPQENKNENRREGVTLGSSN